MRPPGGPSLGRTTTAPPGKQEESTNAAAPDNNGLNKGHHRKDPSISLADFLLGNISYMIQEESKHQQALTEHQESTKNNGNGEGRVSAPMMNPPPPPQRAMLGVTESEKKKKNHGRGGSQGEGGSVSGMSQSTREGV